MSLDEAENYPASPSLQDSFSGSSPALDDSPDGTPFEDPEEYAVVFAPRTHKFETINFRPSSSIESQALYLFKYSHVIAILIAVFVIGPSAALLGFAVDQLERFVTLGIYRATTLNDNFAVGFVIFIILSSTSGAFASLLVLLLAPGAAGSGIPELKSYLNGVRIPGYLQMKTLAMKLVGLGCALASGLIIGRQGPVIHIVAILGAGLGLGAGRAWSIRLGKKKWLRWWKVFRTEAWKRDFVAIGASAGAAVAFGSPIGAWIWVYEEACTHWNWQLALVCLAAC